MGNAEEFLRAASVIGAACHTLDAADGAAYIQRLFDTFKPDRTDGHLMIGHESDDYPLQAAETDFSLALPNRPARILFDQLSTDRGQVLELVDGPRLCEVMSQCFGMEYFVSDIDADYLIAVNWYVVEVAGSAREWLKRRYEQ